MMKAGISDTASQAEKAAGYWGPNMKPSQNDILALKSL
jgi:hypothetical protein